MPELPDVENFKKYFKKYALYKNIKDISAESKKLIHKSVFDDFKNELIGDKFFSAERRGKYLISEFKKSSKKLVFHFGMTGYLLYNKEETDKTIPYSQVRFKFKDGGVLHYINKRMLGKIYLVDEVSEINALAGIGHEPLKLSEKMFFDLLKENKNRNIKAFLMDQSQIAGIGNEYSDEILFHSGINPKRKIDSLSKKEKEKLFDKIKTILKKAIKVNPANNNFDESWLLSHRGRGDDMLCPKNKKHKLKKETISGRSSVYCSKCQK